MKRQKKQEINRISKVFHNFPQGKFVDKSIVDNYFCGKVENKVNKTSLFQIEKDKNSLYNKRIGKVLHFSSNGGKLGGKRCELSGGKGINI
ncbi:MAG: hypothetical protein HFE67_04745 [Erysipelotrichaceae bacterium]|nr:hypothetical protein [Erysipelotrichaceae bacterium]